MIFKVIGTQKTRPTEKEIIKGVVYLRRNVMPYNDEYVSNGWQYDEVQLNEKDYDEENFSWNKEEAATF